MVQQFKEQGGAATMDPNPVLRWVTSAVMTRASSAERLAKKRARCEKHRVKAGQAHVVEYFHEVDDGYSHLAAQMLKPLLERYRIELVCHLVGGPVDKNAPEPELLLKLSRYDAFKVAPHYGLQFPQHDEAPRERLLALAVGILAAQDAEGFIEHAAEVGRALWADDEASLRDMAERLGLATEAEVAARTDAGNRRREELQHYSGAMFDYGEEWYWGVDRLYHLEKRLAELGADLRPGSPLLAPRPAIEAGEVKNDGSLTLEVVPSLRSPYTAVGFDRAVELARDTGVRLVVRPVLPMVMRGVPATRQKGLYIFFDAAREAREAGVPYGDVCDPIGNPVRRCYSLYPWACEQGRGIELLSSFLRAAFVQGINTNSDRGLRAVVEQAGLDWEQARRIVGRPGWEEQLEQNRQAMYAAGLWGVPSFRLLDERGESLLALWGQDRLWLFAREIRNRTLAKRQAT